MNISKWLDGMKLLPRLVIVLTLCLIAVTLPAVPAQAQCGGPSIKLSPQSGPPGTEVTVNGQGFYSRKWVGIYYDGTVIATGETNSQGDFTIPFTVPEGYTGAYMVRAWVFGYTADAHFTVKPGLTVSPEKGPVGAIVTVKGQGFAKNEEGIRLMYYLNGSHKTVERLIVANAQGSWEANFSIPLSTNGAHKIDAEGTESQLYEVEDAIFTVTPEISIDKSSGIVDESIVITGSRFTAYERGIQILFAGQAMVIGIKADSQGDWEEIFEVPEMPTGEYSVTAEGTVTHKEDTTALTFEIKPDIVLSSAEGHMGMNLTVTGHGFAANERVDIMYDGSQEKTAETNDKGTFDASLIVLEKQHSERQVIARDAAGNNATVIFIMRSTPPDTPVLISPPHGSRVGFIGKVTPTLEWSEVSDPSGVYYNLQIATSANVTTGGFANPIVSVQGLAETSYTLNSTDALPYGTYYWIVQAVDRVENAGNWTVAYSFRAGLLPKWGFIAAIVVIVVILGALIRFLARRKIYYY